VEATRLLDTADPQDRPLTDDSTLLVPPTRVIAAWGDTAQPSFHGPEHTARGAVRFFADNVDPAQSFAHAMQEQAGGQYFDVRVANFTVPNRQTHYEHHCVSRAQLLQRGVPLDQELHAIGFQAVVTTKYVHHFILYSWDPQLNSDCTAEMPGAEVLYGWTPGHSTLELPHQVGVPLGGTNAGSIDSFLIQIHYDNPHRDAGVLDDSGVRIYYTAEKRKHDMGTMAIGDPFIGLHGQPVNRNAAGGVSQHVFECPSSCTATVAQPVTVFQEHLHMHKSGASASNAQIRNGVELRKGTVQYWDFDQQGSLQIIQEPFQMLPGDSFRTTCNYVSPPRRGKNKKHVFGISTDQEMCSVYLLYYPRQPTLSFCGIGQGSVCEGQHHVTPDFADLGRSFGSQLAVDRTCDTLSNDSSSSIRLEQTEQHAAEVLGLANEWTTIGMVLLVPSLALARLVVLRTYRLMSSGRAKPHCHRV